MSEAKQEGLFNKEDSNEDIFASAMESVAAEENDATISLDSEEKTLPIPAETVTTAQVPELPDDIDLDDDDGSLFSQSTEKPKLQLSSDKQVSKQDSITEDLEESFKNAELVERSDELCEITVSDPQKIGDGMGSYVSYKVSTRTNLKYFRKGQFSVNRRFSDFLGLHEKLVEKHLHSGYIIPPAPGKDMFSTSKIKIGKNDEQGSPSEFLERRKCALERYLNRTADHPNLRVDPDFREFLELDADLPKATNTSALSGAGVLRLFTRVGDSVNKMTFKMDENDAWFEDKTQQIESLDAQLKTLHTSVEALVSYRRDLAVSTDSFAKSAAMLSSVEEHTGLSRVLSQLSEIEEKMERLHINQANADFYHLSELLKDYINLIGAVKEVFHERIKMYQMQQHCLQTLNKKRENKAKLELQQRSDKLPQAREEVIEWEAKLERSIEAFDNISRNIKKEMERFDVTRIQDFRNTIIQYLESLLTHQQQLVKYWESFLPEAKAIV